MPRRVEAGRQAGRLLTRLLVVAVISSGETMEGMMKIKITNMAIVPSEGFAEIHAINELGEDLIFEAEFDELRVLVEHASLGMAQIAAKSFPSRPYWPMTAGNVTSRMGDPDIYFDLQFGVQGQLPLCLHRDRARAMALKILSVLDEVEGPLQ